ncbi:MAG: DUF5615 family PIN-like protein [Gammaproteobacteria bacterium]|nr:DUF5615 family PIN-like protein [Gammaproteobacteria bacterium]
MKLLIDENLSPRLVNFLSTKFPGSVHVRDVGLARADDETIWSYARDHGFAIVSKDSDFHLKAFKSGPYPKVIWIQRGNCTTKEIMILLEDYLSVLRDFDKSTGVAFLELG